MKKYVKQLAIFILLIFISASETSEAPQPDLTIIGRVNRRDGIGRQALEVIEAFKDQLSINCILTRPPHYEDVPLEIKAIIDQSSREKGKVVLFEDILYQKGRRPYQHVAKINREQSIIVAYSMFESSSIPKRWSQVLNRYFDAVAVPDPYLKKIYKKCGVKIPIFVLPLGINLHPFLKEPIKTKRNKIFTFGTLGQCQERKNLDNLVNGFAKAFGNNTDYCLVINCRDGHRNDIAKLKKTIQTANQNNIFLSFQSLSNKKYIEKFTTFDCFVNVAKGEGFAIQPREAMALGIPTIVANNTAQTTICNSNLVCSVKADKKVPAHYWCSNQTCGFFYEASSDDIADAMLKVVKNYDSHLEKAEQARLWASQYNNENLKPLYQALLSPNVITLGEEDTLNPHALTTSSPELYEKYCRLLKK